MAQSASSDNGTGAILGGLAIITICTSILNLIYSLVMVFILPAAYALFLNNNEEIGAGFRLGEIFALIKKAPVAYLLTWLGSLIAGMIGGAGVIASVVGLLITIPFSTLIVAHFYGQAYNEATKF